MSEPQRFVVFLAEPYETNPVYWEGQAVEGTVVLDLQQPMEISGIHVRFIGEANVHWTERHSVGAGDTRRMKTFHYRSAESYFNNSAILYGKPQGDRSGNNPVLAAGHYEYPFSFLLPEGIPSSFESTHGRIRYYLFATIDKPSFNTVSKRPFTVLYNLDLNTMPQLQTGIVMTDEKTICCLCCASGPIQIEVRLDRTGFVPGEFVFVTAAIRNNSSRRVATFKLMVHQIVRLYAATKQKHCDVTLAQVLLEGMDPYDAKVYPDVALQVPPTPASGLTGCSIMHIDYYIRAVAAFSGLAVDLVVMIPVVIGSTPMADSYSYYMSKVSPPADPNAEPTAPPPDAMPPPSYNELYDRTAISNGDSDSEAEGDAGKVVGEVNWAPRYTFYAYSAPGGQAAAPEAAPEMTRT